MPELGRVIGRLWATSKYADLEGATIQIVVPLSGALEPAGEPFVAVDTIGAGPGDLVLYVTAFEAVIPYPRDLVPIDASLVGIVDAIDLAPPRRVPRAEGSGAPKGPDPKKGGAPTGAKAPKGRATEPKQAQASTAAPRRSGASKKSPGAR